MQFLRHAPWHPAWETEGRIVQTPVYTTVTSRKQLFSVGYFQHFTCLFRIKEDGRISHAALDHQNCKDPINHHLHLISGPGSARKQKQNHLGSKVKKGTDTDQTPLCCSHAKEVEGRERRAALSPWRKCRHGGSALTLLTRQFLNMRSFWTADLNITAL